MIKGYTLMHEHPVYKNSFPNEDGISEQILIGFYTKTENKCFTCAEISINWSLSEQPFILIFSDVWESFSMFFAVFSFLEKLQKDMISVADVTQMLESLGFQDITLSDRQD